MGRRSEGYPQVADPEVSSLGPAMRALTPGQRRFVVACLSWPSGKDWQLAKAAGFSDRSHGALRVAAHRLRHDEKVIAAMREESDKRLRGAAPLGVSVLIEIAQTRGHRDQLKAAEALLNRIGFHEKSEHKVSVEHHDGTGAAMVGRIEALAKALGIDPAVLLGVNGKDEVRVAHEPKLIEGEVVRGPSEV